VDLERVDVGLELGDLGAAYDGVAVRVHLTAPREGDWDVSARRGGLHMYCSQAGKKAKGILEPDWFLQSTAEFRVPGSGWRVASRETKTRTSRKEMCQDPNESPASSSGRKWCCIESC
jgi:hypothetical protein